MNIINLYDAVKGKASSFVTINMLTLSVGLRNEESDSTHATCGSKDETYITNGPDKEDIHNTKKC